MGHNFIGRALPCGVELHKKYIGHNYMGHNFIGRALPRGAELALPAQEYRYKHA